MVAEAKRLRVAGQEVVITVYKLSRLGRRLVETGGMIVARCSGASGPCQPGRFSFLGKPCALALQALTFQ